MKIIVESQWIIDEHVYLDMMKVSGFEELIENWWQDNAKDAGFIQELDQEPVSVLSPSRTEDEDLTGQPGQHGCGEKHEYVRPIDSETAAEAIKFAQDLALLLGFDIGY